MKQTCIIFDPLANIKIISMKKQFVFLLAVIAGIFSSCNNPKQQEEVKTSTPNVIIIVADDLGYSDIAPFGGIFKPQCWISFRKKA